MGRLGMGNLFDQSKLVGLNSFLCMNAWLIEGKERKLSLLIKLNEIYNQRGRVS